MESEHFKSAELRCRHCGREGVRRELLDVLEALRAMAGPLKVNSAYRCRHHPVEARKPKPGFHARGLAADLVPLAMSLRCRPQELDWRYAASFSSRYSCCSPPRTGVDSTRWQSGIGSTAIRTD